VLAAALDHHWDGYVLLMSAAWVAGFIEFGLVE